MTLHPPLNRMLVTGLVCIALAGCQEKPRAPRGRAPTAQAQPDQAYPVLAPLSGQVSRPVPFERGPAEPSGGVWIEELRGFLVVDDESTVGGQRGLYFLTLEGTGGPKWLPVSLAEDAGRFQWDDLEAVAASPDRIVWLASHAHNSAWRQRICHAPRKGFEIVGHGSAHPKVSITGTRCTPGRQSRAAILAALAGVAPGSNINLEGMAWAPGDKAFYIGVRQPLAGNKAIILRMAPHPSGSVESPSLQVVHTFDLDGRGVRGMTNLGDNKLLLAAGPVGDEPGRFDLYLIDLSVPAEDRKATLLTPRGFPRLSPDGREIRIEGLAFDGHGLLILCDSGWWRDDGTVGAPAYYYHLR